MDFKLSIIVPTHNSEKYIRECVESIMHQTYENLEIICVDSSRDNTISILQELAETDSRIQIIRDANGSYGHKINVGIQQASGEYIGIVESDDYILQNMYTDMLSKMGSEKVDFIKSNALHFGDINGRRVFCTEKKAFLAGYFDRVLELDSIRDKAIMGSPTIWTALYRKAFLVENEIWLNETPGASYQDTAFAILVGLLAKNCIYDNHAYYCYRRDNDNSSVLSKDKVDYVRQEFEYAINYLCEHNLYTQDVSDLLARKKLITYNWNCLRLSDDLAMDFIASVQSEMKEYDFNLVDTFTDYEKKIYCLLAGMRSMQEHRQEVEDAQSQVNKLLDILSKDTHFVLVGAGKIGEKVLQLQAYVGDKFIDALADNSTKVIGSCVDGYNVVKVEDAVEKYPNHTYIVANKDNASDIENQLISLGTTPETIVCISAFPDEVTLLIKYIEYYK